MKDKEWEKQISQIEKDISRSSENRFSQINFGWLSALFMALSIGSGVFAVNRMAKGAHELMCSFMNISMTEAPLNGGAGARTLEIGTGFIFVTVIILVIAIACAGGGIATQRGVFPSVIVLFFVLAPLVYIALQIFFDLPNLVDISSLSPSTPNPSVMSNLECPS